MSFQTSIYGNAPANTFVYTTTTVSVDNISVENASITNATISVLKTDLFNPVNVAATNINCTTLTVTDDGNFSEIYTHYIHTSNMSLDGVLGGNTGNFATINADNATFDAIYLNEQSSVLTDKSLIRRDANEVMFIGKNISTDTNGVDYIFRTGLETDAVKLRIPRTTDIVEMIALDVDTTINAATGIFDAANISDLNVIDTTTLSELEVLTSASIKNLTVVGPNGLIATKAGITNASIINLSVLGGMNAAGTSRFNFLTVDYFQSYLTAQFEALTSNNGNISSFLSYNISNDSGIKTTNLSAINASVDNALKVRFAVTCGSVNASTSVTAPIINGNISNNLAAGAGINLSTVGGVTTITNTGLVTSPLSVSVINASTITTKVVNASSVTASGTILAKTLTGNVGGNLVSGAGINLSTNVATGITTITNTGIITDPLNLSTLNASTINVSLLNADNIEGFTKSTEYAFRASSTSGGQTLASGNVINFNLVQLETPPPIIVSGFVHRGYNTNLKQYLIHTSGIYAFGFNMYYNNANYTLRIGIYKNGVLIASGGNNSSTADSVTTVVDCLEGEWIDIKVVNGSGDTVPSNCSFWGYKLIPANNLITSSTNLSIQNLSVADDMSATTITATNLQPTNFIMPNVTDTFNVSGICNFSNLIRCGVLQGLNISAPIIRAPNMYTSNISATTLDRCLTANISFVNASNVSSITINTSKINGRVGDFEIAVVANEITGSHFYGNNISMTQSITCANLNVSQTITADNIISNNAFSAPSGSIPNFTTTDLTINDKVTAGQAEFERANNLLNIYGDKTSSPDIIITPASSRVTMTNISSSYLTGINASLNSMTVNTSAKINVINSSQLNVSNISGNIATINSLTAYYSTSEYVYFTNNAFGAPGTADAQPAILFKNGPVFEIRSGSPAFPGNINFTRDGTITNMIYDGNLNISSKANISNISATNLTLTTALTGAANINITGDVSAGIISGATLTGDIGGNLTGTGIVLTTTAGVTNISNSLPYEIPISRIFSRTQAAPETPSSTSLLYYTTFNASTPASSPHVTYVAPNIDTGGANTGFIIQTAGTYKVTFTICVHSVSYNNRVSWWTRLLKNNATTGLQSFIYTRGDNTSFAQYGSASATYISNFAVNDYLQIQTLVAKNSPLYNNNFDLLRGFSGSQFVIELIS